MNSMTSAVLILNPTSGSSVMASDHSAPEEHQVRILAALRTYGIEPTIHYTTPDDTGHGLATQAVEAGVAIVIAAGGDGTLHAVASALIGTKSTLGIIPMGTMNNIAHSLEIPENIEEACAIIATGDTGLIDIGKMNDHVFLEVAGIGIEAVLFPVAEEIKSYGVISTLRGIVDGLKALFAFRPTRFSISFDGRRTRHFRALQISTCNAPYYGAHLQFAPNAVMDDGFLDVLIYRNFSKLAYMRHAMAISRGQHTLEPKVLHRKARSLRIRSQEPAVVHTDGVQQGSTPALITILPGALQVRIPKKVSTSTKLSTPEQKKSRRYTYAQQVQRNPVMQ
jgi:YegS/Rv2252/BmrU family lipid kinase